MAFWYLAWSNSPHSLSMTFLTFGEGWSRYSASFGRAVSVPTRAAAQTTAAASCSVSPSGPGRSSRVTCPTSASAFASL